MEIFSEGMLGFEAVAYNLAKVGVEGSNPFTRSIFQDVKRADNWLESLIFFRFVTRPSPLLSLRAVKKYFHI